MANSLVSSLSSAIAKVENTNPSLNNPGGIMDYQYYKDTGQFRLQQYSSPQAGQDALQSLVTKYVAQGNTLDSFFGNYAPYGHGSNDPAVYAQTVSGMIGVPTDVPLNTVEAPTYSVTAYGVVPTDVAVAGVDVPSDGLFGSLDGGVGVQESSIWGSGLGIGLLLLAGIVVYKIVE